jgi:hypothetical protein
VSLQVRQAVASAQAPVAQAVVSPHRLQPSGPVTQVRKPPSVHSAASDAHAWVHALPVPSPLQPVIAAVAISPTREVMASARIERSLNDNVGTSQAYQREDLRRGCSRDRHQPARVFFVLSGHGLLEASAARHSGIRRSPRAADRCS